MMKKIIHTLLFVSCTIFNLNGQSTDIHISKVIVSGHVTLGDSSSRIISLSCSCATNRCDYLTAVIDAKSNFRFEFKILHPIDVTVKYENGLAQLIVYPFDSIYLTLNAVLFKDGQYPLFEITGKHAKTINDIQKYASFKQSFKNFSNECANKTVEKYLSGIRQNIKTQDSILELFNVRNNPTMEFLSWAKKDIVYSNANYLIDFEYYHFMHHTKVAGELFDKTIFPINDDAALVSSLYSVHLWHYAVYIYGQKDSIVKNLLDEKKLFQADSIMIRNILAHEQPGLSRDLMCYQIILELLNQSVNDFSSIWKNIDTFLQNKTFTGLLKTRKDDIDKQANYQVSILDDQTKEIKEITGDLFSNLQKKHKGNVLFLDFWATWCGPCRVEIPYSIELQQCYKGKPIVFVNICMFSDEDNWKKAVDVQHLTGDNIFLNQDQSAIIKGKLGIQGFPTYMIIDKVGHIVDKNAPRPSSGREIKSILNGFCEQ